MTYREFGSKRFTAVILQGLVGKIFGDFIFYYNHDDAHFLKILDVSVNEQNRTLRWCAK